MRNILQTNWSLLFKNVEAKKSREKRRLRKRSGLQKVKETLEWTLDPGEVKAQQAITEAMAKIDFQLHSMKSLYQCQFLNLTLTLFSYRGTSLFLVGGRRGRP
jgi:hypothetical protein